MPDNYYYTDLSGNKCTNIQGLNGKYCPPPKVQCTDTDDDGFLMSCDKLFCTIKCRWEPKGEIPYVAGDKIMFQLQFRDNVNPDPKIPIFGWGDWVFLEVWDASTMTIWSTESINTDSRNYVCHNGVNSYQVIEVDTGAEGFPCAWFAKFYSHDFDLVLIPGEGDELDAYELGTDLGELDCRQSHNFKQVDECTELHMIEGIYEGFDCLGNYYGTECENFYSTHADHEYFTFTNKTRIEGKLVKKAPTVENDEGLITVIENYKFVTTNAKNKSGLYLNNFIISWYITLFSAKTIKIDENSIETLNFALSYLDEKENVAVPIFSWNHKCSNCHG